MRRTHVCSRPGCPNLVPCKVHGRPRNARWSSERDPKAHAFFARAVKARAGGICERCGIKPCTVAHHVRPGYDPEDGLGLCDECHKTIDNHARNT